MADAKAIVVKGTEAGAVGVGAGITAYQVGAVIDSIVKSKFPNMPDGFGFVIITGVIPAIYRTIQHALKDRKSK